jgi:NADP-dependent 3-hydroxy acid dehydrogenase YdfG
MNTIDKLVRYIASKVTVHAPAQTLPAQKMSIPAAEPVADDGIHRFTISVTGLKNIKHEGKNFNGRTFLISTDTSGFTEKISEKIKNHGGKVLTIGTGSADCAVDMTDPLTVEKAVTSFMKNHGDINCFIHLNPIDYVLNGTFTTGKCIESSIKSFFMIMKNLHEMFRKKDSIVASLSFNSVVFPYAEVCGEIYPVFAGVAGMLKTINKEFKDATVKAVDFSTDDPVKDIDDIADTFVRELLSGDRRVEVGYRDGKRFGLMLNDGFVMNKDSLIRNGSTLAATGGAGGITFEILARMARDFRDLKLIVLDRIDIDSLDREFLGENITEQSVIASLKKKMPAAKPLEVKNAAGQIMRARKAVSNIEALKKSGASVDYHAVDVNSAESVAAALKSYKKIDGILHAAGMEESQILEKMTFDSFNRVFNVKGYGVLNILAALENTEYNFFAAFSSVAARFGNEGQTNYSGANDMLSKTLFREKAQHTNRVYKVCDWTAWEGAGMAMNETVHKVLKERGMTFIPLERGIQLFLDELCDRDSVESVFTGIDRSFDHDGIMPGNATSGQGIAPFLDTVIKSDPDSKTFSRTLELNRDLFLSDHAREGTPLFLGATGIETMAEAAAEAAGNEKVLTEMRDFHIPYSIKILKGRPKEIIIRAEKDKNSPDAIRCSITSQFKNPKGVIVGDPTLHYEGTYLFSGISPEQPVIRIPDPSHVETDIDFQKIIYHPERLFMDGSFRTVQNIHYFDEKLLVCTLKHAPEKDFFTGVAYPEFLVDVVLIDAMFQTGGIFEMLTTSDIILPSKINKMIFYRTPERDREYLCFTRKIASGEEANTFTLTLADREGHVYMDIDRFDMVKVSKVPKEDRIDSLFRIK